MKLKSLTIRIVFIALVLFVGFAGVSTVGLLVQVRSMARDLGVRYAVQRVETAKARISGQLQREAALANKLADSPTLERWMLAEHNQARRERAFAELASYREAFVDSNYFVAIHESKHYYNRPEGKELVVTTLSADSPADEWYFATLSAGEKVSFNLDYNAELDVSKVWINCLSLRNGEVIGMAGTGLEITDFISRFLEDGRTAAGTMITDLDGTIIAHPDERIMEQNAKTDLSGDKVSVFDLAARAGDRETLRSLVNEAVSGETQVAPVDFEDRALVTAVTRLSELDALMVESVDASAFVSTGDFLPLFVLVAVVILVAVAVLAFMVERSVLLPLSGLTRSARRIAEGEYHLSVPGTDRGDEIGTLSSAFEHMASQVAAYTRRLEQMVEQRTAELTETNRKLDDTNRQLTESIRYARLIQDGVMAGEADCSRRFPQFQLFRRQRDMVGGDFLFLRDTEEGGFLLAVIDCEGHGVSGALMTMMADSLLRQIVPGHEPRDPAAMLADVERAVGGSLDRGFDEHSFTSGFDIGLCACFPADGELVFAGAGMPLYIRNAGGEIRTVKGRRKAIRSQHRKPPAPLENHRFDTGGNVFFMLTDGFVDQPRGNGETYGTTRLYEFLSGIEPSLLDSRNNLWEEEFESSRGSALQRDDVLAIGFTLQRQSTTMEDEGKENG
jgi:serine phosphatase RsbU (regulator of sigma subunit)